MVSSLGRSGTSFGVSARLSEFAFNSGLEVLDWDVSRREVSSAGLLLFLWDGDMQFPPSTLVDIGDADLLRHSSKYSSWS